MKTYTIPEDHLFRLIETCHNENNCIQGDVDCKCQQALNNSKQVSSRRSDKPLRELFNKD